MGSFSPVSFSIVFALLFFASTCAEEIDPLSELDVVVSYRVDNRPQCQRLCWYWKTCVRSSFYGNEDHNFRNNCVLHGGHQHNGDSLVDGWTDEKASDPNLSPSNGCKGRPCSKEEMCVPVFPGTEFTCIHMNSDAWLGQRCREACQSPPSAGNTTCVHGQCLCTPGHFYSESRRTCLSACEKLGKSFLFYKGFDLGDHDMYNLSKPTDMAVCKKRCVDDTRCKVFVYSTDNLHCWFKNETALTKKNDWNEREEGNTYQRTCT